MWTQGWFINLIKIKVLSFMVTILYSGSLVSAAPGDWTWLWGDKDKGMYYTSIYGTEGVPSEENYPAPKFLTSRWVEPNGDMWMYGGCNVYQSFSVLGEFWKFDSQLSQWIFIGGSKAENFLGIYGELNVPSETNLPPGKAGAYTWIDNSGKLWMFGGSTISTTSIHSPYIKNDLWTYDKSTNIWTWVGGPQENNIAGIYDTKGIESDTAYPGARFGGNCWFNSQENSVYIFGGYGYGTSSVTPGTLTIFGDIILRPVNGHGFPGHKKQMGRLQPTTGS